MPLMPMVCDHYRVQLILFSGVCWRKSHGLIVRNLPASRNCSRHENTLTKRKPSRQRKTHIGNLCRIIDGKLVVFKAVMA